MKWQIVQGVTTTSHHAVMLQQTHHMSTTAEVRKKKNRRMTVIYEICFTTHVKKKVCKKPNPRPVLIDKGKNAQCPF